MTTLVANTMTRRAPALAQGSLAQFAVLALCCLGFAFDIGEVWFGSALATIFSGPPHSMSPGSVSMLLSAAFVGAAVGAPLFGLLADRRGRRYSLRCCFATLALGSLLVAASPNFICLLLARAVSGLALGGVPPQMVSYLSSVLPNKRRGMLVVIVSSISLLGAPGGLFLMRFLSVHAPAGFDAWRMALVIGGFGSGLCSLLFRQLPEVYTPKSSAARVDQDLPALKTIDDQLDVARHKQPRARVLKMLRTQLYVLFFSTPWATVAFPQITGAIFVQKGFRVDQTLMFVGFSTLIPIFGALIASPLVDKIHRRTAMFIGAGAMAASVLAFSIATMPVALIASLVLFNISSFIYLPIMNVFCAELEMSVSQGTLLSEAWSCNRIGAIIAPLILLPLSHSLGPTAMATAVAVSLLVSVLLTATLPRDPMGTAGAGAP